MDKADTTPGAMRVITADARQEAAGAAGEGVAQLLGARGLLPRSLSKALWTGLTAREILSQSRRPA